MLCLRRVAPLLSTSVLLILVGVITLGTNLLLACWLPEATGPHWTGPSELISGDDGDSSDLLHVVTSRFMQMQPHLLSLGKARLLLFETFCLPSMLNQEVDNFAWFVMTDPDLHPSLLNRLKSLLEPHANFYLVLMNKQSVTPGNLTDITKDERIVTGDIDKLYTLLFDLNRPLLLETRLDADDGLHSQTLFELQKTARSLPKERDGWQVICNNLHYEWRNDVITAPNQTVETTGRLRLVMENICVTPGYTLVKHREPGSNDFPAWPKIGHHLIVRDWPECFKNATTNCYTRLPMYPAALRSRTITSAGMSRVETKPSENFYDNQTVVLWNFVERDYGITPDSALRTSQFLHENLANIVEDNLQGQW